MQKNIYKFEAILTNLNIPSIILASLIGYGLEMQSACDKTKGYVMYVSMKFVFQFSICPSK